MGQRFALRRNKKKSKHTTNWSIFLQGLISFHFILFSRIFKVSSASGPVFVHFKKRNGENQRHSKNAADNPQKENIFFVLLQRLSYFFEDIDRSASDVFAYFCQSGRNNHWLIERGIRNARIFYRQVAKFARAFRDRRIRLKIIK